MHTIMTQHNDDQPALVKYLRQQLDSSFPPEVAATATPKATATKKPAAKKKKPDNTIAMPKKGEKIKWGGQEFKPGDPMYDKMQAAGGVKESAILSGVHQVNEGWKSALGSAALAGAMALGGAAHGRVLPDQDPGINRLTGKPVATQVAQDDEKPAAKVPSGYSAEYLQSVIDGSHPRPMLSVEKAKQLLQQQGQQ